MKFKQHFSNTCDMMENVNDFDIYGF